LKNFIRKAYHSTKEERPERLNGIKVRETDTFTYFLKGKGKKTGWQEGFSTISQVRNDMKRHSAHLVDKLIMVSINARSERGERTR